MAEIQMQNYEEIRREDDNHKYVDLKIDEKKMKIKHVIVPWKKWIKTSCLALTIYILSTGFILTVIYFTVIAQLQQKFADIDMKLAAIENINGTKLPESENRESTNLDNCTMTYNGEIKKRCNNSNQCVCAVGYFGKHCEYSDGKGTSFMVIFLGLGGSLKPKILVASETMAHLSVFYFNNNQNQSVTIDNINFEYNLTSSVLPSDDIHSAGVEVHSDIRMNVYGFLYDGAHSEGFLLMPMRFASTQYIIPTTPYGYGKKYLALTTVDQNTTISINLKMESGSLTYKSKQYINKDILRIVMNKYNTFQLSHTSDLSGTLVTASKPVVAVSGNQCSYAGPNKGAGGCSSFIEVVLPSDQLDNIFITPHLSTRLNITVRIHAIKNTKLTIKIGNKNIFRTLDARDVLEFYYSTISFIFASADILVMSYPHGLKERKGDPFMITIPGVNQYLYEYDFVVPKDFDSFISITVQSDSINGFVLDGYSFNTRSVFSISEGLNHFSTFSMSISNGFHHIEHRKKLRFGLWIYGNGDIDGYGYPAGIAYKNFN